MKKRQLILNDYRTAEDGLFTLSACKITKAAQEQTFVKVPGRFAPLDLSTVLTDGQPYYGNASLDAVLESSEGTRAERQERIDHMKNLLDGHVVKIIHPDFPGRYLVGRVEVAPDFNGLAYCSVSLSAVLEPWLYNDTETVKEAILPFAEVTKIGGTTRKTKNLFNPAKLLATETWSVNASGVYSGSSGYLKDAFTKSNPYMTFENVDSLTLSFYGYFAEGQSPNGLYFQFTYDNGTTESFAVRTTVDTFYTYTTKAGVKPVSLCFSYGNAGGTHYLRNIQIEEGTVATEYEPYFEGLRSAPVTEVESVGANLFDITKAIDASYGGSKIEVVGNNITYTYGTNTTEYSFAFSCWIEVEPNTDYFAVCKSTSLKSCYVYTDELYGNSLGAINAYDGGIFNSGNNRKLLVGFYSAPSYRTGTSEVVSEIMISKGSTALPYSPYTRNTIPIPTEVQALDGYGDGINDSCYNYVDWEKKQFVKRVDKVDLGSLGWVYTAKYERLDAYAPNDIRQADYLSQNALSELAYNNSVYFDGSRGDGYCISYNKIFARNSNYTDATAFKSAMQGVMLYYELAEPIITDISDLLTEDAPIGVEGGGTITMANEHGFAVPSEVTFTVDSDTKGVEDFSVAYRKAVPGTSPQGTQEHVLTNEGRLAVVPVVEVVGEVTLKVGNSSRALSTGTYLLPDLYLTPGEHRVLCSGAGMATITYREAVLAG